jgi:NAD dependent epimerase/dehydratase family enzyme
MKFRLKNRNVVHTKLFNPGFKFGYPELKEALKKVID